MRWTVITVSSLVLRGASKPPTASRIGSNNQKRAPRASIILKLGLVNVLTFNTRLQFQGYLSYTNVCCLWPSMYACAASLACLAFRTLCLSSQWATRGFMKRNTINMGRKNQSGNRPMPIGMWFLTGADAKGLGD
jgi:hypothetical protein